MEICGTVKAQWALVVIKHFDRLQIRVVVIDS
jgi:hypothetical protein